MNNSKIILITGATSGIGRYSALYLARHGHHVIATGRKLALLEELAKEAEGLRLDTVPLDVTDEASIDEAVTIANRLTSGYGIDVLVNNAGYGIAAPMSEITDGDLRRQFDTNVFGLMAVTRAFLPEMRERRSGRILNVSSIGGRVTMPLFGVYSASKYAVEALSDALRMELHPFGIRVALIEPGPINTKFTARAMDNAAKYRDPSSPYAAVVERAEKLAELAERTGVSPAVITRAIRRAMTARYPRARYVAPLRGLAMVALVKMLPTRLTDAFMRAMSGFTARRINATERPSASATQRAA